MKKMIAMLLCLVMPLTAFGCVGAFAEATDQKVEVTDQMVEPTLPVADFGPQSEEVEKALIEAAEKLPDKLDLRDFEGKNYVTPVKNQSPYGSCWTFGITAAAEISFLHDNGFGVPAGEVNDLVDFSEKYISWFVRHPITEEEVQTGHVRASQVGEGYDPGEAEKTDINTVYNIGGSATYGTSFFAAGFGPQPELEEIDGWQPYAYRGKNGWRLNDTDESEEAAAARREYYKNDFQNQMMFKAFQQGGLIPEDMDYEDWCFNSEMSLYHESFGKSEYAPYDDWSIPLTAQYLNPDIVLSFKNSYNLPSPSETNDLGLWTGYNAAGTAAIKAELARGHGVSIGYWADQSMPGDTIGDQGYMNTTTWAQYYDGMEYANHQVTIVGYDDNYPKENFTRILNGKVVENSTPPADGAWIVKNSWGALTEADKATAKVNKYGQTIYDSPNASAWGIDDTGYFYLSYYDHSINAPVSFEFYPLLETKYAEINYDQYDLMLSGGYEKKTSDSEIMSANVYEAEEDEYLFQISTMTIAPRTTVRYAVYKDIEDGNPASGALLEEGETFQEWAGYQRIDLKEEHLLNKGEKYAVVITQSYDTDEGKTYAVPYPQNANAAAMFEMGGVTIKSTLNPGESYIFIDGAWKDFYNFKDEIINSMAADLASLGEETDGETDEEALNMLMALIGNISMDDITLDNLPIKAYLVSVETYNEAKANEKAD